jgi:hypothetical protein
LHINFSAVYATAIPRTYVAVQAANLDPSR